MENSSQSNLTEDEDQGSGNLNNHNNNNAHLQDLSYNGTYSTQSKIAAGRSQLDASSTSRFDARMLQNEIKNIKEGEEQAAKRSQKVDYDDHEDNYRNYGYNQGTIQDFIQDNEDDNDDREEDEDEQVDDQQEEDDEDQEQYQQQNLNSHDVEVQNDPQKYQRTIDAWTQNQHQLNCVELMTDDELLLGQPFLSQMDDTYLQQQQQYQKIEEIKAQQYITLNNNELGNSLNLSASKTDQEKLLKNNFFISDNKTNSKQRNNIQNLTCNLSQENNLQEVKNVYHTIERSEGSNIEDQNIISMSDKEVMKKLYEKCKKLNEINSKIMNKNSEFQQEQLLLKEELYNCRQSLYKLTEDLNQANQTIFQFKKSPCDTCEQLKRENSANQSQIQKLNSNLKQFANHSLSDKYSYKSRNDQLYDMVMRLEREKVELQDKNIALLKRQISNRCNNSSNNYKTTIECNEDTEFQRGPLQHNLENIQRDNNSIIPKEIYTNKTQLVGQRKRVSSEFNENGSIQELNQGPQQAKGKEFNSLDVQRKRAVTSNIEYANQFSQSLTPCKSLESKYDQLCQKFSSILQENSELKQLHQKNHKKNKENMIFSYPEVDSKSKNQTLNKYSSGKTQSLSQNYKTNEWVSQIPVTGMTTAATVTPCEERKEIYSPPTTMHLYPSQREQQNQMKENLNSNMPITNITQSGSLKQSQQKENHKKQITYFNPKYFKEQPNLPLPKEYVTIDHLSYAESNLCSDINRACYPSQKYTQSKKKRKDSKGKKKRDDEYTINQKENYQDKGNEQRGDYKINSTQQLKLANRIRSNSTTSYKFAASKTTKQPSLQKGNMKSTLIVEGAKSTKNTIINDQRESSKHPPKQSRSGSAKMKNTKKNSLLFSHLKIQ